ncbi:diacylglycerol/lipid kinase family protein [Bradymonas sediminis]|uniref:Uncharacterized protein n=1 Tax=Bradymonas sediminis TaxID=1548548 RepID=A0A2Z4FHK1_9DELT|nr:diacylglycerol kinase family protein [Bradymonas sediminis]AWV88188.1 hypothetical protein DN745_02080 [Bradymonas sediminis]TDP77312.1 diacylglycerol kinase [Bradymonas sediminis]
MSTRLIINPNAGSAPKNEELIEALEQLDDVEVCLTECPGDAERLAREAAEAGVTRVIAAGGDGTANEVLNGLSEHLDQVTLGVLPLGTGNDLSRSLGLPDTAMEALPYLLGEEPAEGRQTRRLDVLRVSHGDNSRIALNHINAGYGNLISSEVDSEKKQKWGPFAYMTSAAAQVWDREEYRTKIRCNGTDFEEIDAVNIFVVNGRTIAGGFRIAPLASMEDGLFEVLVMRSGSLVELAEMVAMTLVGKLAESEHVVARAVHSLHIESVPPMTFSVDGEPFDAPAIQVDILPAALEVIVGPDYQAHPDADAAQDAPKQPDSP